ncbi:hypothetical protein RD792_010950 [Penstemon davidsonii]|uniref:Metaxin n=1 Tax=Penstemon davidsonii TaxID=160366 RepID=A0ABR0D4N1_9LAMI|nr:hypothetical protein RD792_010950 [Penstemon davidsonii]
MENVRVEREEELTLVARKPFFGLPTACSTSLPVYIYLKFSKIPFTLEFKNNYPDSDQIPFVECGDYVAYNNVNGGVIKTLKEDKIVDLDSDISSTPEWVSMKAMVESWLKDAVLYELWVGSDGKAAHSIYYSDLPWPIGKVLHFKQVRAVKQLLAITSSNAEEREQEIYDRASMVYKALSSKLEEESFFFERPTSLDAVFLGHVLFTLHALPETSILKSKLLEHPNLVTNAEKLKSVYIDSNSPSADPSSSASRRGPSRWSSKPEYKSPKREKTEEEKQFRRRSTYFLASQFIAVLVFITIFGGSEDGDVDDDGIYE